MTDLDRAMARELDVAVHQGVVTDRLAAIMPAWVGARVSPQLVDDLSQEVLAALVEHLHRLDQENNPFQYVGVILANCWKKRMRKRRAERRHLIRTAAEQFDALPANVRSSRKGKAWATAGEIFRLKYY